MLLFIYISLKAMLHLNQEARGGPDIFINKMFLYSWTACEPLIILETDSTEVKDYGIPQIISGSKGKLLFK
jgi:hypothetical protein